MLLEFWNTFHKGFILWNAHILQRKAEEWVVLQAHHVGHEDDVHTPPDGGWVICTQWGRCVARGRAEMMPVSQNTKWNHSHSVFCKFESNSHKFPTA